MFVVKVHAISSVASYTQLLLGDAQLLLDHAINFVQCLSYPGP